MPIVLEKDPRCSDGGHLFQPEDGKRRCIVCGYEEDLSTDRTGQSQKSSNSDTKPHGNSHRPKLPPPSSEKWEHPFAQRQAQKAAAETNLNSGSGGSSETSSKETDAKEKKKESPAQSGTFWEESRVEQALEQVVAAGALPPLDKIPPKYRELFEVLAATREEFLNSDWESIPEQRFSDPVFYAVAVRLLDLSRLPINGRGAPKGDYHARVLAAGYIRIALDLVRTGQVDKTLPVLKTTLYYANLAGNEALHDEATNLIAYHKTEINDYRAAAKAIQSALEGELNDNLISNAYFISRYLEMDDAVNLFARLIGLTTDDKLKMSLIRSVLERVDEEYEDAVELPMALVESLQGLLISPSISEKDFVEILVLYASTKNLPTIPIAGFATSPHRNNIALEYYTEKKNSGALRAIPLMKKAFDKYPSGGRPDWLIEERDRLVSLLLFLLMSRNKVSETAAFITLAFLDAQIPIQRRDAVAMSVFACMAVTEVIEAQGEMVSLGVIERLAWGCSESEKLEGEDSEEGRKIARTAANIAQIHLINSMAAEMVEIGKRLVGAPKSRRLTELFYSMRVEWHRNLVVLWPYLDDKVQKTTTEFLSRVDASLT